MEDIKVKCAECFFWEPTDILYHKLGSSRRCHRSRPFAVGLGQQSVGVFPVTLGADWCGDFKAIDRPRPGQESIAAPTPGNADHWFNDEHRPRKKLQ